MASPTTVLDDDWITKWQFHQHNGSAWEELGGMLYDVPDVSGDRGRFNFYSGAIGSGVILSIDKLTTKIGDADGTAFVEIDSVTGQFDLHGTARVTKSIWLNPGGIRAPGAKPATFIEYGLTGAWQFADAIEANQESVSGTLKISADMDITVAPTFHIGWSANGVSPGNCEWQLEYLWISPNEATNAAAQETLIVTAAASSTSEGFTFSTITGVDVPTATDKAMLWRITRKSGHANDTIADTVELRGCALTYTSNKLGTAT
ncbi:MAG: hypothetical protein GQ565_02940 [Candidatus Aegiribacteria sp.]|nr:hypothetical protein [Candidatus Aegiribacteria sp.]